MMFLQKEDIWALSITITGRCNCDCSYCHFYASHPREQYNFDIDKELFSNYCELITTIRDKYHNNLQVRFSGGEPLVLGDRLFEYSQYLYKTTGIKPYILTNGQLLDEEYIEKSKQYGIEAFLVSIENPFSPSKNAPVTDNILDKIKRLDNNSVRVLPAIMVVENKMFKHLFEISEYVYGKIGMLPSFSELTYHAFECPTKEEIDNLYTNMKKIACEYYGKADIRMFPYVSPELYANDQKNYLTELDLENSLNISAENIKEVAERTFLRLESSYKINPCQDVTCDWYEDCRIVKWLWLYPQAEKNITCDEKLRAYCEMKNAINNGLLDGIEEAIG